MRSHHAQQLWAILTPSLSSPTAPSQYPSDERPFSKAPRAKKNLMVAFTMENSDRPQSQNPTASLGQTTVEGRTFLTSRLPPSLDPITHPSPLRPHFTPPSHSPFCCGTRGGWLAKPPARQRTVSHSLMVPDNKRQPRAIHRDRPGDEPAATTPSTIGDPSRSEKNIHSAPPSDRTRSVKIVVFTPTAPSPPTNTGDGILEVKP
ncbi:hypothetical protein EDB86DRAFT_1384254 [Lactarius hatsudake]|nr:hypothetical protein EDB86DRAFT_1384254 [Lactarius hatsudake]